MDHSLGEADYYDPRDYAGVFRRLLIYFIDLVVLVMLGVLMWIPLMFLIIGGVIRTDPSFLFWTTYLLVVWGYLAPIKRSRFGTLGYRLMGINIVSAQGGPPSLLVMTARMLIWILTPFSLFVDLFWIGADSERQILRDCYLGTYLIKRNAKAIGRGPVNLTRYFAMSFALAYPRVRRPKPTD
ncbi:RDD family protein [Bremerella volcania]|uniref:RDD family protein n=1 Tax=Bremerella volcania TaxID=2527984 RepID=UPI0013FCF70F|nr:RDD family protein [Bremerella volcania]